MGKAAETRAGNTVTVFSFVSPVEPPSGGLVLGAADIKACAAADATAVTGVSPALFTVETADKTAWPSVPAAKKPALGSGLLPANKCVRGWVTFRLPEGEKPLYVDLVSSAVVKWQIP
jgi:hypothetical protein